MSERSAAGEREGPVGSSRVPSSAAADPSATAGAPSDAGSAPVVEREAQGRPGDGTDAAEAAVAAEQVRDSGTTPSAAGGAPGIDRARPAERTRSTSRSTGRTRAPKQDPVLTEAVALAREAVVLGGAEARGVGEHVGVRVHEDRLLTHLFDCELPGYPGWTWYATVARAPRSKHVTVCESGMLSGPHSLLAPEWVPWEERVQDADIHHGPEGDDSPGDDAAAAAPEHAPAAGPDDATPAAAPAPGPLPPEALTPVFRAPDAAAEGGPSS